MSLIKTFLSNPMFKAKALKWLRWASQGAGAVTLAWVYAWLHGHIASLSTADAMSIAGVISGAVAGLILSIGSAILSIADANTVAAKIEIAAATGSTAKVNDPGTVQAVKAASGSPEALQEALSALRKGAE